MNEHIIKAAGYVLSAAILGASIMATAAMLRPQYEYRTLGYSRDGFHRDAVYRIETSTGKSEIVADFVPGVTASAAIATK